MAWNIDVVTNEITLSKKQATTLVNLLEKTWSEYETYIDWVGDKSELIEFFMEMEFVNDFYEHKDYLDRAEVQAALIAVGAEGFVTFADFEGDSKGQAWTHTFKNGKYTYAQGKVRQMIDGRMPDSLVEVPQVDQKLLMALKTNIAFQDKAFVITGQMSTISRRLIEESVSRMGGRRHAPLSGKTFALIAGVDAGPAKLAKAKALGIAVWDEDMFLVQAGLKESCVPTLSEPVTLVVPALPFAWYFEEFDLASQSIVKTGFFREGKTVKPKKGFGLRTTPLFTH